MSGPDRPVPPPPPGARPGARQDAGPGQGVSPGPAADDGRDRPELQRALGDLEGAVRRLAGSAQREWSDRAVDAIDEAAGRLRKFETKRERREYRRQRRYERRYGVAPPHGEGGHHESDYLQRRRRPRRLYRVPKEGVIAGVCAGLARRMGLETWVVRCFAVTGLLFMPQVVFIAYWVLCFTMRTVTPAEADAVFAVPGGSAGRASIPGFDRGVSPRDRLRAVRETFDGIERRLRRMEGYVTSSRYELDREIQKLDD